MFKYTGHDPSVIRLVNQLNDFNARGLYLNVGLNGSHNFDYYQHLNIALLTQPHVSDPNTERVIEYKPQKRPRSGDRSQSFKAKINKGEIVCSDYLRYKLTVSLEQGNERVANTWHVYDDGNIVTIGDRVMVNARTAPEYRAKSSYPKRTFFEDEVPYIPTGYRDPVRILSGDRSWSTHDYEWANELDTDHPVTFEVPRVGSRVTQEVLDSIALDFLEQRPDADALLKVYRDLDNNRGDFLTAIAEMRESIEGIHSNVVRTMQWIRNMKLRGNHWLKETTAILTWQEGTFVHVGSRRSYKKFLRKTKREKERLVRRLAKEHGHSPSGIADRISGHWLDAIYGITPNLLTIRDLIDTTIRMKKSYVRKSVPFSDSWKPPENMNGWELVHNGSHSKCKVWGARRYDFSSTWDSLRSYTNANPLATAWELMPLSFAWDWCWNIGDILHTIEPTYFTDQKFMAVWKRDLDLEYKRTRPDGEEERLHVRGYVYIRAFVKPEYRFAAIIPEWNLSWKNYITSVALAWARFRNLPIFERIKHG